MTHEQFRPDTLHRAVKMALDTGEVDTIEAGYALFAGYRLSVRVGPEVSASPAHQAALLTVVNIARRSFLGGVEVSGRLAGDLAVPLPGFDNLEDAVVGLGGRWEANADPGAPTLIIGSGRQGPQAPISLRVSFGGWRGGAWPEGEDERLAEEPDSILAAVLAAALGVSEAFQHLRGNVMAARRVCGMSLWQPDAIDWRQCDEGPTALHAPTRMWILGLGHLGQAFLWTLSLLTYEDPAAVQLTLHDHDALAAANDSTSVLTHPALIGRKKTRAIAAWAERRGFQTRIIERPFTGDVVLADDDPRILVCGVDNPQARALVEKPGFELVVEAGLGGGPQEYLALRMHTFPASVSSQAKWGGSTLDRTIAAGPAYDDLSRRGKDGCGLVEMASRTVGAPFVGVFASTLIVAEILRRLNGGRPFEVIDATLRDLALRQGVGATRLPRRFSPGSMRLNAGLSADHAA